jgi:hypothetical protein
MVASEAAALSGRDPPAPPGSARKGVPVVAGCHDDHPRFFGNHAGMDERITDEAGTSPPLSLAWRCAGCGYYQLFDAPAPRPAFCKLCGSLEMSSAGLTDPVAPRRERR